MAHVASKGVLHANLNCQNLLLVRTKNGRTVVKIAGFEHALFGHRSWPASDCNTLAHLPEARAEKRVYLQSSDVWSYGRENVR